MRQQINEEATMDRLKGGKGGTVEELTRQQWNTRDCEMKWVAGRRAVTSWHATRNAQLSLHCGATFTGRFTSLVRSSRLFTGTCSPVCR